MGVTGAAGEFTPRERPSEFAERLGFHFIKSGVSGRFLIPEHATLFKGMKGANDERDKACVD